MHHFKILLLYVILMILAAGCVPRTEIELFHALDANRSVGAHRTVATQKVHTRHRDYHFRPYDTIAMTIYGQPESSTRPSGVLIDGAGYATLPIVGRIHVAGLNESSASRKIQRLVKRYDTEAIVIVENPNKTLFVIGDVKKPGTVKLTSGQITLLRAIGSAGGFQDTANRDVVYLVRQRGTTAKLTRLSLSSRRSLRDAFYVLVPGDIVYVAPNSAKMVELGPMSTLKIIMGSLAGVSAVKAIVP